MEQRVIQMFIDYEGATEKIFKAGMSEIRDRAKAAPAKSRSFQDSIFPASGKKFRSVSLKPPISSA